MTTIRKIVFHPNRLSEIPEEQRRFFIFAGHILNELNFFNKMMLIFQRTGRLLSEKLAEDMSEEECAQLDGNATQILVMTKLFAGKLYETIKFLERWAFNQPWFERIKENADLEFQLSLQMVIDYIEENRKEDNKNILKFIRNKFAFHYDKKAVRDSTDISLLNGFTYYLGKERGNGLYYGSEEAINIAIMKLSGYESTGQVLERMITECLGLAPHITEVIGKTLLYIMQNNLGERFSDFSDISILNIPSLDLGEFRMPFFWEVSPEETKE